MNKRLNLLLALFLVFSLVACGKNTPNDTNNKTDIVEKDDNKKAEKPKEKKPAKALPKNLPIYPDSYITDDFKEGENAWTWVFYAPASAKEIKEFFNDELSYLGLQLVASKAMMGPIFSILTLDYHFGLAFVEESDRTVDENTTDREYAILLSHEEWDESLTRNKENDPRPQINLETVDSSEFGDKKPERDIPKILPVYPGSTFIEDGAITMTGTRWQWGFHVDASEDNMVEFFEKELSDLGIEFTVERASEYEEVEAFLVRTKDRIIEIIAIYVGEEDNHGPGYIYHIEADLIALNEL